MKKLIVAAVMLSAASASFAQDAGFYTGVSAGYAKFKMDFIDNVKDIPGSSADDSDTGYKLTAGYTFNENFALEAFYINGLSLGTNFNFKDKDSGDVVNANGTLDTSGVGLAAVLKKPVSESASVYGKLGAVRFKQKLDLTLSSGSVTAPVKLSDKTTAGMIGLGAEYKLGEALSLKAEYEISSKSGDQVHFLSAGVAYNF